MFIKTIPSGSTRVILALLYSLPSAVLKSSAKTTEVKRIRTTNNRGDTCRPLKVAREKGKPTNARWFCAVRARKRKLPKSGFSEPRIAQHDTPNFPLCKGRLVVEHRSGSKGPTQKADRSEVTFSRVGLSNSIPMIATGQGSQALPTITTARPFVATVHVTGIFAYMNRVAEAFGLTAAPPPNLGEREAGRTKAYCHAMDDRTGGAIECPCTGNAVKDPYASA